MSFKALGHSLLIILSISLIAVSSGCGNPTSRPEGGDGTVDPADGQNVDPETDPIQDPADPTDPNDPKAECRKNPSKEGCACILHGKNSKACVCSKANPPRGCKCFLNPDSPECVCETDPDGAKCFCKKNPAAATCLGPTNYQLCAMYCALSETQRNEAKYSDLRDKLKDVDCDDDGLTNKEEEEPRSRGFTTNPCHYDTDGDDIPDGKDTSPNDADQDGDGITDKREKELGLDPTKSSTKRVYPYGKNGDNMEDNQLWILGACDKYLRDQESIKPEILENKIADWQVVTPSNARGYLFDVIDQTSHERRGGAYIDVSAQSIYAAIGSEERGEIRQATVAAGKATKKEVEGKASKEIKRIVEVMQNNYLVTNYFAGGESPTHDGFYFSSADFYLKSDSIKSSAELRGNIFWNLMNFQKDTLNNKTDIEKLDSQADDNTSGKYFVKVTAIYRGTTLEGKKDQVILLVAVTPEKFYRQDRLVQARLEDLTNTTGITQSGNAMESICVEMQSLAKGPMVYFYFVADESKSMEPYHKALAAVTEEFFSRLDSADFDFMTGVTNINPYDPNNHQTMDTYFPGTGLVHAWTSDKSGFDEQIGYILKFGSGYEKGFLVAQKGIEQMVDQRPRPEDSKIVPADAILLTTWITDEPDRDYIEENTNNVTKKVLTDALAYFPGKTTAFAIVKNPSDESEGQCYVDVALATGGAYSPLTDVSESYSDTLDQLVRTGSSYASPYELPQVPITSTLQVIRDNTGKSTPIATKGEFVPRSIGGGFGYNPQKNSLSFYGKKWRLERPEEGYRGRDFITLYHFFLYKIKVF